MPHGVMNDYNQRLQNALNVVLKYADQVLSIRWNTIMNVSMEELLKPIYQYAATSQVATGNPVMSMYLGTLLPTVTGIYNHYEQNYFRAQGIVDIAGMTNAVQRFVNTALQPRYRQYFSIFERGHLWGDPHTRAAQAELCAFVGRQTMVDFYAVAGIGDSGFAAMKQYENGQITEEQLAYSMYLNNKTDVIKVAGAGWATSADLKRELATQGINITMDEAKAFILETYGTIGEIDAADFTKIKEFVDAYLNQGTGVGQLDQQLMELLVGDADLMGQYNNIIAALGTAFVTGTEDADFIFGHDDGTPNMIIAGGGDDIILAGTGDDWLEGGAGNDTYFWRAGDGNDTIFEDSYDPTEVNTLFFGEKITADKISIAISDDGYNAEFTYSETGETITVADWFSDDSCRVQIKFMDGTVWTADMISEAFDLNLDRPEEGLIQPNSIQMVMNLFNGATNWDESSVASLMGGVEGDTTSAQKSMALAVAGLQFDAGTEQVFDFGRVASIVASDPTSIAGSGGSNVGSFFSEENRRSA